LIACIFLRSFATATTATLLAAGFAIFVGDAIFADGCLIFTILKLAR
jgi:hypothetical protein